MIVRFSPTVAALAIVLMASGGAMAGGMPSDEGPEVVPDALGFNGGDKLDEDTITAIIKSLTPEYLPDASLPAAYVPAAYVTAVVDDQAVATTPLGTPKLPPALDSPEGDPLLRDHR